MLAIEADIEAPDKSKMFTDYPRILADHHMIEFITDCLRLIVGGNLDPHELESLLEYELETHHQEAQQPAHAVQRVADALPGFGIVAAVLGIVDTMASIDGADTGTIGRKVGAALVGTFLGILVAYGFIGPIAAAIEHRAHEEGKAFEVVKMALVASVRGYAPPVAVEFARKLLFGDVRPTFADLENHLKKKSRRLKMAEAWRAEQASRSSSSSARRPAAGHHGGAWKVAYADFVTAMMAFFMVMWLVAAVSKEQRAAIFDYFKNPSMQQGKSPRASMGQMGPGGASTSVINLRGALDARKSASAISPGLGTPAKPPRRKPTPSDEAKRIASEAERKKLESLMAQLREAIDHSQALRPFKDQLLLDITPEGLRIQIVDAQNRPMFDLGSAKLKDYTGTILHELAALPEFGAQSHQPVGPHRHHGLRIHGRLYQLGSVGRSRQRGAARARGRRSCAGQGVARGRPVLVGAVRQGQHAQPDQPAHQHHRDDEGNTRAQNKDQPPAAI